MRSTERTEPYVAETAIVAAFRHAHASQVAAYDADDLLNELCEVGDELLAAVRSDDPALIGRLVLAVVAAQIERRAAVEACQESAGVWAKDAVRDVLEAAGAMA